MSVSRKCVTCLPTSLSPPRLLSTVIYHFRKNTSRFYATRSRRTLTRMAESANADTLTEQQLRFCHEYAVDPNATQAYIRSFNGCAYNTARTEGAKLLANPRIALEIAAARESHQRACRVNGKRTLLGLANIAFLDPAELFDADANNGNLPTPKPWNKVSLNARRAVQGVKVKRRRLKSESGEMYDIEEIEYKLCDKMAAFDKLCKHLGLTKEDITEAAAEMVKVFRLSAAAAAQLESSTPVIVDGTPKSS